MALKRRIQARNINVDMLPRLCSQTVRPQYDESPATVVIEICPLLEIGRNTGEVEDAVRSVAVPLPWLLNSLERKSKDQDNGLDFMW